MKMRWLLAVLAAAGAAVWAADTAPAPAAGIVPACQGAWFKLRYRTAGFDNAQGQWQKEREKAPVYLQLQAFDEGLPEPGDERYAARLVMAGWDGQEGTWDTLPLVLHAIVSDADPGQMLLFARLDQDGDVELGHGTRIAFAARVKVKLHPDGTLRKATFQTLGGYCAERAGGRGFAGEMSLAGKSVDPGKLPFTPGGG
jgi:hypothetical protein